MASRKSGLGKGLDSLITGGREEASAEKSKPEVIEKIVEKVVEKPVEVKLKISEIEPNREQPRKDFNEDALEELADSIREYGVLQPLLVQKENGYYKIIAGERRWRAAKKAGLKEVPVIIKDYTSQQLIEISLIENIQREDLNPIEEAMAFKRLLEEFHLKQDEVAERVSKSRVVITNAIRLLKLDDRVQNMLINDMLSAGHGRALVSIENKEDQYALAIRIVDEKLSVRETERMVQNYLQPKKKKEKVTFSESEELAYQTMQERLKQILGSKVTIQKKDKGKGKIEIEYYSTEELERLMELMNGLQK